MNEQSDAEVPDHAETEALICIPRTFSTSCPISWCYPLFRYKSNHQVNLNFGLSLAILPRAVTSRGRRQPAFVNRVKFIDWLDRFEPSELRAGELTSEEKAREWLTETVRQYKPKENDKEFYRNAAKKQFPELSVRAFNKVWDAVVPSSWKEKGRKPKPPG